MKNKKYLLVSSLMCLSALTGCEKDKKGNDGEPVYESHIKELLSIDKRNSFLTYENNIKTNSNKLADFTVKDDPYVVGTDNPFKLGPALTYLDDNDNPVITDDSNPLEWAAGWTLELKTLMGADVPTSSYSFDTKKCEVKLGEDLVGQTLKSIVKPVVNKDIEGGDQGSIGDVSQEFTFEVRKGYNVYNGIDFNYFDNRDEGTGLDYGNGSGDTGDLVVKTRAFKAENGLNPDYHPELMLVHNSIDLLASDVPSELFYTESELQGEQKERSTGSWKDFTYPFQRVTDGKITVNGNYFKLSLEKFPLVTRHRGKDEIMGQEGNVSHSALFKVDAGVAEFKNLSVIGNGPNAKKEEDTIYAGGDIFIKAGNSCSSITIDNVLCASHFISLMSESPDEGLAPTDFKITNSKFSDNYNSFLYNWGGQITATNCYFGGCGGPVIIQDHTNVPEEGPYESKTGSTWYGFAPKTSFIDCELINMVHGGEAWFKQFGATALIPAIKQMSFLYAPFGKTFLYGKDANNGYNPALCDPSNMSSQFFNFIVLNKSGSAQGITVYPVCGEVNFVNTKTTDLYKEGTTTFNYLKADKAENYVTHMSLRKLNDAGAPVFETKGGVGTLLDQTHTTMDSVATINVQQKDYYDYGAKVLAALKYLEAKNYSDVDKINSILHSTEMFKGAIAYTAAASTGIEDDSAILGNLNAFFVGGVFELAKDALRSQFAGLSDEKIQEQLLQDVGGGMILADQIAAQYIYPQFEALRSIVMFANILNKGVIYSEQLGLIDIVALYRGMNGISKDIEVTISEAVAHLYKDADENSLIIAEIASNFLSQGASLGYALSVAQRMSGATSSTEHFGDQASEYTAIYYNGMMLVFGLGDLK